VTAREVHAPPREGLSATGNAGFARNHRWPKWWEVVGANGVATRWPERRTLWSVQATCWGAGGGGRTGDHQWKPENPLVRSVSCKNRRRREDLDSKISIIKPFQKLQRTR